MIVTLAFKKLSYEQNYIFWFNYMELYSKINKVFMDKTNPAF